MNDKERAEHLEATLARMLQPVRNVPFSTIVRSVADYSVEKADLANPMDHELVEQIEEAAKLCADALRKDPIKRPRPNEVGNDIEKYVLTAIRATGLLCDRATAASGKGKTAGYPDLLVTDRHQRATYLECKVSSDLNNPTSFRSFYLSPSSDFKISQTARHFLLAYNITSRPIDGSNQAEYTVDYFKLIDLHDLLCDVKYEFNSDNRRLYGAPLILTEGPI